MLRTQSPPLGTGVSVVYTTGQVVLEREEHEDVERLKERVEKLEALLEKGSKVDEKKEGNAKEPADD